MALSSALTSKRKSNELGVNSMALFPTWYFDESKMAGVSFEDAAEVEAYDRNQTSVHQKRAGFSHSPGISSGHTVIDLGVRLLCNSGFTRWSFRPRC